VKRRQATHGAFSVAGASSVRVCPVAHEKPSLPAFVSWPTFPFRGALEGRPLEPAVEEPAREGDDPDTCKACRGVDSDYIWVSDRWRVRTSDGHVGLPAVMVLESRSHLDLGDLPNLLAAELGVMTVRLERAIRSLPGVARVHVNRWGDDSAHLQVWFFARPTGQLQLRGGFLPMWNELLPPMPGDAMRDNIALVSAWLADFGGRSTVDPPRIEWQSLGFEDGTTEPQAG
jgi:hypothetical protein